MVLFKLFLPFFSPFFAFFLHSNMVLFKSRLWFQKTNITFFYIPIWFYSNNNLHNLINVTASFTFQYGSIQILRHGRTGKSFNLLHSNMVLFKFSACLFIIAHTVFTFQYGSIQMHLQMLSASGFFVFTFQYGSIQITET